MKVQFSKHLSVRTFSEDTHKTVQSSEDEFFLCSILENLTHILTKLNELNCETTTYHQFYRHIHPRISSMLGLERKVKECDSSDESWIQMQTSVLEKIKLLREKNWELCDHFNQKYQPLRAESRQRLLAIGSLEDLSSSDS